MQEKAIRVGPIRRYRDLLVYQQAYRLTLAVSQLSKAFPRHEQNELGKQIRRCSRSIAANIVEGWAKRESAAEFRRHLQIAIGECEETRFWLDLVCDEGCAARAQIELLEAEYAKLGMMIHNLWKEWRKLS
jgi:four helix bundle protein